MIYHKQVNLARLLMRQAIDSYQESIKKTQNAGQYTT